jgi:hypothetical protein
LNFSKPFFVCSIKVISFTLIFSFSSCREKGLELDENQINFQPIQVTNESHNSEAKLVSLGNEIIMIFRSDTSYAHVSNQGKLVLRRSGDLGNSWGAEELVYDSEFDDRNHVVGLLPNGKIIVVFRRYDNTNDRTIDSGFIIGDSNEKNWSTFTPIPEMEGISNQPFGKIFLYEDRYPGFLIQVGSSKTILFYSNDNFSNSVKSKVIWEDSTLKLYEPNLINLGNGKSMILYRNGDNRKGAPSYIQFVSADWENYRNVGGTNMFEDYSYSVSCPVSIRLSDDSGFLEVTGNSRRLFQSDENLTNEIRIYRISISDALYNPKLYSLIQRIERPWPSKHWMYGYPDFVEIESQKRILYIFTESKLYDIEKIALSHLNNEEAQLFTFFVKI